MKHLTFTQWLSLVWKLPFMIVAVPIAILLYLFIGLPRKVLSKFNDQAQ